MTIAVDAHMDREKELFAREWIVTNGCGGYASTTIAGCNTRKYHGLLVAPLPSLGKIVFLNRLEVTAQIDGSTYVLGTARYPGACAPAGYQYVESFTCDPTPSVVYACGNARVRQSFRMPHGEPTLLVQFEIENAQQASLSVRVFPGFRDMHALTQSNPDYKFELSHHNDCWAIAPYDGLPELRFDCSRHLSASAAPAWYYRNEYGWERDRGFDYHEDLPSPGLLEWEATGTSVLRASIAEPCTTPDAAWQLAAPEIANGNPIQLLSAKADDFIVTNGRNERSIIAGYHWFGEWGRDAMIALPGLTLTRGKLELAREILETYAKHEQNGLIPNYLAATERDQHAYNSIDASLWFTRALQMYGMEVGAENVPALLVQTLDNIIQAYLDNRVPLAHLDNGAIWAGSPDTQLTWMDANAYGKPVTPRHGFAIELNALWLNALYWRAELAEHGHPPPPMGMLAVQEQLAERFVRTFWIEEAGYFADTVNERGRNALLRPNQVFALALPYRGFPDALGRRALACVRDQLLTPYGLRTLAPNQPGFCPRYTGTSDQRDSAYHQGTVWPWLIGSYVDAELIYAEDPEARAADLLDYLRPLWDAHVRDAGIGGISEIFDATEPHYPNGCITQAWSVSELLRAHQHLMRYLQP